MQISRRHIFSTALCVATLIVVTVAVARDGASHVPWGEMATAPASLDGLITISTSPDTKLLFVTCEPHHPSLWHRLVHTTLSGAFVVQHGKPTRTIFNRAGDGHLDYEGTQLTVVFADSTQFVFSVEPKGSLPSEPGEVVDYVAGLGTHRVAGLHTHSDFVSSHDWTKGGSCGL